MLCVTGLIFLVGLGTTITLDGREVEPGRLTRVRAGPHDVRLTSREGDATTFVVVAQKCKVLTVDVGDPE